MMEQFHNNILNIIENSSYKFFLVQQDFNVKCRCIKEGSNQADMNCELCLGTGYKIKIKLIKGASVDSNIPATIRDNTSFQISKDYYIKMKYPLYEDNMIIDNDEVFYVYRRQVHKGLKGEKVYQMCSCMYKKNSHDTIIDNFYKILNKAKGR